MSIRKQDIGKLWGLAAGCCSAPVCPNNCVDILDDESTMIAEMAHVIPHSPIGPRGNGTIGEDTYENLILLCPYHHKKVDKSPKKYPPEMLLEWKKKHEEKIALLTRVQINSAQDLFSNVYAILQVNKHIWLTYGPESQIAIDNPISDVSVYWQKQKLAYILPNNRRIIDMMDMNSSMLTTNVFKAFAQFKVHAFAFESSAFSTMDFVPRFPVSFEECIYAELECKR